MRLSCRFLGQQRACRWSAATVSPRIQISDEIISSPRHLKFTLGCYDWRLQAVSWPSGGAHRAPEAVASPRRWTFRSRFVFKTWARKRGNLSMSDKTRTNVQQHTQHAPDALQSDSCSQLRTICDSPAVFLANSVRAGGQRRPFHHAFKSLMRSSRLLGI